MRKSTKFLLVLVILLLVAGAGLAIAGIALGADIDTVTGEVMQEDLEDHPFFKALRRHGILVMTDDKEAEKESDAKQESLPSDQEVSADAIRNLKLDLKADELILRSWEKDTIQIQYEGKDSGKGTLSVEGDTLTFTGTRKRHNREVVLWYPEKKQFDKVSIEVDAGETELESELHASRLEVSIGAGELSSKGKVYADTAQLTVGAGAISMDYLSAQSLKGNCGMGSLELTAAGKETDYSYSLKCGLGEIMVGDRSYASFGGKDEITNSGADYRMELECGMGEIGILFSD